MRGKVAAFVVKIRVRGITPACAGKRRKTGFIRTTAGDHPRMCGEKKLNRTVSCPNLGSPPRVRGKERREIKDVIDKRITPACAGKSCVILCIHNLAQDHPRVCGEKVSAKLHPALSRGSPPHVRGKGGKAGGLLHVIGITPACAGKSFLWCIWQYMPWDHPRMCGEKPPFGC